MFFNPNNLIKMVTIINHFFFCTELFFSTHLPHRLSPAKMKSIYSFYILYLYTNERDHTLNHFIFLLYLKSEFNKKKKKKQSFADVKLFLLN